nr:hypothetical protein [Tanacetum cinerariifolium]
MDDLNMTMKEYIRREEEKSRRRGRETWVNLELLMKGSGQTLERPKEALFDEFERLCTNGNELIQDYFVRFHKLVNDMKIVTETVQRRALGNTRTKGIQTTGLGVNNSGKKVICYNCRGEGHVTRQCKEPKRARDSQWYHDKALLMQAKEKGAVLDAEAKAFLADVESFMANLSSIGGTNSSSSSHINEVQISDVSFFGDVSYPLAQEMQQEEHLNSEVDLVLDDNMITSAIFLEVASLFFRQWQLSSLAVGTSSGSGNTITGSGNALCILFPTILL